MQRLEVPSTEQDRIPIAFFLLNIKRTSVFIYTELMKKKTEILFMIDLNVHLTFLYFS